ncbi:MAG: hypothetical protein AB8I08_38700 [Sandaracinaceae bacterium]
MTLVGQLQTDRGEIRIERRRPGLLVSRTSGHMDVRFADLLIRVSEEEIVLHGVFTHFMDWRDVVGYDSEVRRRCTAWAIAQGAPHPRIAILTSNRLVHMGVSAAALALALTGRSLESHTDPARFQAELRNSEVLGVRRAS